MARNWQEFSIARRLLRYINVLDDWRHIYVTEDMCIIQFMNIFDTFTQWLHTLRHIPGISLFM